MSLKTPEQIEFTDLAKQLKARFGFNQRKIAAISHVSESMVSQIVAGTRSPRGAALELLRREFEFLTKPVPEDSTTPDQLREVLVRLQADSPGDYEVARATIESLNKKVSSARLSSGAETGLSHASAAKRLAQESARKPKAGGPSGDKSAPGGDVGKGKK